MRNRLRGERTSSYDLGHCLAPKGFELNCYGFNIIRLSSSNIDEVITRCAGSIYPSSTLRILLGSILDSNHRLT